MIRNTEDAKVHASASDLWDEYLRPAKLEQILPSVNDVTDQGDGIYEAEMVFTGFDFHMGVMFEVKERRRPERLHLASNYPDFDIKARLVEHSDTTKVTITVELDLPPGMAMVGEDRVRSELEERMSEQIADLEAEVNNNHG